MRKLILVFLAIIGLTAAVFAVPANAATKIPRKIDGVMVDPKNANPWVTAVMIDNHPAARPQSGLSKASVIYESLAEGGIPRFMALFVDYTAKTLGPVRSTRPYFVRYAAEYPAAMVHAGGSPDALAIIKSLRLINIEGIKGKYAKIFFRGPGGGVHALFTTGAKVWSVLKSIHYDRIHPKYLSWNYVNEPGLSGRANGKHGAKIDLGAGLQFAIRFEYDKKTNTYKRFTGGRAQIDKLTKKQLAPKNLLILVVPHEKVLDKKGRLDLHTIGQDKGVLLKNGKSQPIIWKKKSNKSRTFFLNPDGSPVQLNRGQTWIVVVPRGHKYTLF